MSRGSSAAPTTPRRRPGWPRRRGREEALSSAPIQPGIGPSRPCRTPPGRREHPPRSTGHPSLGCAQPNRDDVGGVGGAGGLREERQEVAADRGETLVVAQEEAAGERRTSTSVPSGVTAIWWPTLKHRSWSVIPTGADQCAPPSVVRENIGWPRKAEERNSDVMLRGSPGKSAPVPDRVDVAGSPRVGGDRLLVVEVQTRGVPDQGFRRGRSSLQRGWAWTAVPSCRRHLDRTVAQGRLVD